MALTYMQKLRVSKAVKKVLHNGKSKAVYMREFEERNQMGISEIKPKPNGDAIEVLEAALEKAKSGEYVAVSVCWLTADNSVSGKFSSGPNNFLLWVAMEHASRSFYTDVVCESVE